MKKDLGFIIILGIILALIIPVFNWGKGTGDFMAYWSAAHLFATGGNPYSQAEMISLQHLIDPGRFSDENSLINTWNPPWLILLFLPIGVLPITIATPIWIFCNVLIIGLSLIITWKLCQGEQSSKGMIFVFLSSFLFVETISYLAIGQITSIVLLGIVLVNWYLRHDMDVLAGIALFLTTVKLHIVFFFIILILIWVIRNHRWKVIIAFTFSGIVSMVIFWIVIPNWLNDYIYLLLSLPISVFYTSTIGSFLSIELNSQIFRYSGILLILLIKPLLRVQQSDGWLTATNLALLVSMPLSPYGYNFDHIMLLISIVQIIAWASMKKIPKKNVLFISICLLGINFILAKMISIKAFPYYWFFWVPIALLGIYIYAWKISRFPSTKFELTKLT
jgi:hypothetical protein